MIPKLGDQYAIVASHRVRGPFYVIGVRGSLVALGTACISLLKLATGKRIIFNGKPFPLYMANEPGYLSLQRDGWHEV